MDDADKGKLIVALYRLLALKMESLHIERMPEPYKTNVASAITDQIMNIVKEIANA